MIKKILIFILPVILIISLLYVCIPSKEENKSIYNVEVFKSGNGWGYQIKSDEKILILQTYMPCVRGNIPFPDKNSALKTGKLVMTKMMNLEDPTITMEELNTIVRL